MKSKRVSLESPEDYSSGSILMKKLREKFKDNSVLGMHLVERDAGQDQPQFRSGDELVERRVYALQPDREFSCEMEPAGLMTPQKEERGNFSFSKSALMKTNEETDLKQKKDFCSSGSKRAVRLLDLKVFHEETDDLQEKNRIVSCLKSKKSEINCEKKELISKPKFSQFPLHTLHKEDHNSLSQAPKQNHFIKEPSSSSKKRVSCMLMPRPGELASQISLGEDERLSSLSLTEFERCSEDYDEVSSITNSLTFNSPQNSSIFGSVTPFHLKCIDKNNSSHYTPRKPKADLEKKISKLSLRSPDDYKIYGLKINSQTQTYSSPSHVTHAYLPLRLKDDEKYKKKLLNYIRGPKADLLKTDTQKANLKRKFSEAFDGNLSRFHRTHGGKIRKICSEKKLFESHKSFFDNRAFGNLEQTKTKPDSPQYFKYYYDKDIGFPAKWQHQLKSAEMDDDVETDEDQLRAADRHTSRELGEGIRYFMKSRSNVRNFNILKIE